MEEELLLIYQSSYFDFAIIQRQWTISKHYFLVLCKQKDERVKSAGLSWKVMQLWALGSCRQSVIYSKIFISIAKAAFDGMRPVHHCSKNGLAYQRSTPGSISACVLRVLLSSSTTFDVNVNGAKQGNSFLEQQGIKQSRKCVGLAEVYVDKIAKTKKQMILLGTQIHTVLLRFTDRSRPFLIT